VRTRVLIARQRRRTVGRRIRMAKKKKSKKGKNKKK
jgi:hypothetical protein